MKQSLSIAACAVAGLLYSAGCGQEAGKPSESKPAGKADAAKKSLYERLGGEPAIKAVVNEFIDVLSRDAVLNANPKINEARKRVNPDELKAKVTAFMCQITGGPQEYTGRSMKESHAHLNISGSEWNQMARDFVMVLDKFKVPKPEQEELLKVVGSNRGDIVLRPNE